MIGTSYILKTYMANATSKTPYQPTLRRVISNDSPATNGMPANKPNTIQPNSINGINQMESSRKLVEK